MVSVWGMTDKGIVRRENQDSCAYDIIEEGKLAWGVVCDGMGGAKAGDVASKMAVEAFCTQMDQLGDLEGPPPAEALLGWFTSRPRPTQTASAWAPPWWGSFCRRPPCGW